MIFKVDDIATACRAFNASLDGASLINRVVVHIDEDQWERFIHFVHLYRSGLPFTYDDPELVRLVSDSVTLEHVEFRKRSFAGDREKAIETLRSRRPREHRPGDIRTAPPRRDPPSGRRKLKTVTFSQDNTPHDRVIGSASLSAPASSVLVAGLKLQEDE